MLASVRPSTATGYVPRNTFDKYAYGDPSSKARKARATSTSAGEACQPIHHADPKPKPTPNLVPATIFVQDKEHVAKPTGPATSATAFTKHPLAAKPTNHSLVCQTAKQTPPVTYQTLKRDGETPEDVIARLQAAGKKGALLRIKRAAVGEPITCALSTLDRLREPLPGEFGNSYPPPTESPNPQVQSHDVWGSADSANALDPARSGPSPPDPSRGFGAVAETGVRDDQSDTQNPSQQTTTWDVQWAAHGSPTRAADKAPGGGTSSANAIGGKAPGGRWASAADMKAPPMEYDSNAEGSDPLESDDNSVKPMALQFGRLIRTRASPVVESALGGWDGKMQPPPLDWEQRVGFNNNTQEYLEGFDSWLQCGLTTLEERRRSAAEHTRDGGALKDQQYDHHADGIGFVPRETILNTANAQRYGYSPDQIRSADAESPPDFSAVVKLDLEIGENARYKDETAQILIDRQMMALNHQKEEWAEYKAAKRLVRQESPAPEDTAAAEDDTRLSTMANVYLRPATKSDYQGMLKIYNWHVEHGVRASELLPVTELDMEQRHEMSRQAQLPIIVAVKRSGRNARRKPARRLNPRHPIRNVDSAALTKDEVVVGWASATDWAARDYVETTSVEVEIYVAHDFRKRGVGRCLMDALLEATDKGYFKKGGYEFTCAPELKEIYTGGGLRHLHKLIFTVRSWNRPFTPEQHWRRERAGRIEDPASYTLDMGPRRGKPPTPPKTPQQRTDGGAEPKKDFSPGAKLDDREDDYTVWIKDWLDKYGFEEEAHLKKVGARNQRWVDVRYVTRETNWRPMEGQVLDFALP